MRTAHSFETMGTVASISLETSGTIDGSAITRRARSRIEGLDRTLSRFRADSEISRLNAAPEKQVPLSEDTVSLLAAAHRWRLATGGVFDIAASTDSRSDASPAVELYERAARLTAGRLLDVGGIGKGFAADAARDLCLELGADRVLVNIGSSSIAVGDRETSGSEPWRIGVRSPYQGVPATLGYLLVRSGAVSFSGNTVGSPARQVVSRHILDPRTGTRALTDVALVGVAADDGTHAEALSTAFVIEGSRQALRSADAHGVGVIIFTSDARVLANRRLESSIRLATGIPAALARLAEPAGLIADSHQV